MSKIKNSGLDQYDFEPFEQQQFGTAGVERVKLPDDHVWTQTLDIPRDFSRCGLALDGTL